MRQAGNQCPCRHRNKGPEWATDGTGTHEVVVADGKVMHRECIDSLTAFVAAQLAGSEERS